CPGIGVPEVWQIEQRDEMQRLYGWPIITAESVEQIAAFIGDDQAIDFGAGGGYLASLLMERGIDVVAIDDFSWGAPTWAWHLVIEGDFRDLRGTSDRVLILSWPPRETDMATRALYKWGGDRLVYIGEILRGSAEPPFFRELANNWRLVDTVHIPQWYNRSDAVYLFERGPGVGWDWMLEHIERCQESQ
ncbi:MAG: hypothetical protein OER77_16925, partial [Myxococcales bacterium]|nr:hypothetical protein [Myxococcales bacterium]